MSNFQLNRIGVVKIEASWFLRSLKMRINLNDEKYETERQQGFVSFEQACVFLRDCCGDCELESECEISEGVRAGLRGDNLYWDEKLTSKKAKAEYERKIPEEERSLVVCKLFEEKIKYE